METLSPSWAAWTTLHPAPGDSNPLSTLASPNLPPARHPHEDNIQQDPSGSHAGSRKPLGYEHLSSSLSQLLGLFPPIQGSVGSEEEL